MNEKLNMQLHDILAVLRSVVLRYTASKVHLKHTKKSEISFFSKRTAPMLENYVTILRKYVILLHFMQQMKFCDDCSTRSDQAISCCKDVDYSSS